jgi:hypothetical protein
MLKIRPERVTHALRNLAEWRKEVHSQASAHLFPLLALLEAGAGNFAEVQFDEQQDFEFWDRYLRLSEGDQDMPYFNPILLRRSEVNFPHSNVATIRKNTFALKWKAATRERRADHDFWLLADQYADIFRLKVLTRAGNVTRAPALDIAVILLRDGKFADDIAVRDLEEIFRSRFPQSDEDYAKIFEFSAEDADIVFQESDTADYCKAIIDALIPADMSAADAPPVLNLPVKLPDDDPILLQIQQLLELGTSGIVLTGAPGTGKSYYAHRVAQHLVSNPSEDIFKVQFHPSYGYEDFVEGFRPENKSASGFEIIDKVFIKSCQRAAEVENWVVLLVDEINRGDPARIFGELLTYIERSYRDEEFMLPFSGKTLSIPQNLLLIATMNPHDRSVSHIDAAFVRRFDHIEVSPSREVVEALIERSGEFTAVQITLIGDWFDEAQKQIAQGLGHSFFADVKNVDQLKLVWRYRILPTALTAIELDDGKATNLVNSFEALIRRLEGVIGDP